MKKPNIDRLKYPIWFHVIFLILTVIVPIIIVMINGYKSPSTGFRITFGIITGLILVWIFIDKILVSNIEKKIRDRQLKLEHDYEIDVGNKDKIKWIWFSGEQKLAIFKMIQVGLYGGLIALILYGVSKGIMSIAFLIFGISICYVAAFILKLIVISILKGPTDSNPGGDIDES